MTNSLEEYANKLHQEMNGQPLSVKSGEDTTFTSSSNKNIFKHLQEEHYLVPIAFEGTPAELAKGGEWKINKDIHLNGAATKMSGDYVKGENGKTYRRILTNVEVKDVQNTCPFRMGIKLSGVPVKAKILSGVGEPQVDIALRAHTTSPIPSGQTLHVNDWDAKGISGLVNKGWGNFTEDHINSSIEKKEGLAWHLRDDSPIVAYGIRNELVNPKTLIKIQHKATGKEIFLMDSTTAAQIHGKLKADLDSLPFHDPTKISATLVRMDGNEFASEKIGSSLVPHPKISSSFPEHVGATLQLTYQLWEIK